RTIRDRFWEETTTYVGTMEDLAKIPATEYVVADMLSPWTSSVFKSIVKGDLAEKHRQNLKRALARKAKDLAERQKAQTYELLTFNDIDAAYNQGISEDEKIAFVYYMRSVGRPMENGWKKYWIAAADEPVVLNRLARASVLMFDDGELVPAFIYLSGNVYEKLDRLTRNEVAIRADYGDSAYDTQLASLQTVIQTLKSKELTLNDPIVANRLVIKPESEFAANMLIPGLRDGVKIRAEISKAKDSYGKPNLFSQKNNRWSHAHDEVDLQYAFVYWMMTYSDKITFLKGMDWNKIVTLYLHNRPYSKAKDGDDALAFQKEKARAREEGRRLFGEFLATGLDDEVREMIEQRWNQQFNAEVLPDLDKVPIGFTCAKSYRGELVDIRPEKRQAVAAAMMEGSMCLAYGVGLGKTWCFNFIVAQFFENGWALRPLLVLPNGVYKQFMDEIRGLLPHIKLNDYYNLSDPYLVDAGTTEFYYVLSEFENARRFSGEIPDEYLQRDESGQVIGVFKADEQNFTPKRIKHQSEVFEQGALVKHYYYHQPTGKYIAPQFIKFDESQEEPFYHPIGIFEPTDEVDEEIKAIYPRSEFTFEEAEPYSITCLTQEGFRRIGMNTKGESDFMWQLFSVLEQTNDELKKESEKSKAAFKRKVESFIGKAQKGTHGYIQDLGIDFLAADEAHNGKKIFSTVKGVAKNVFGKLLKKRKEYSLSAGQPSNFGIKLFMVAQYIQAQNETGNTLMLTATPFTNSPLEVYSFLMLVGRRLLEDKQLDNITDFFDHFADIKRQLVINTALSPVYKEVFAGFSNLSSLQNLICKKFLYRDSADNLKRPNKIVLPLKNKLVNGQRVSLTDAEKIDTVLPFTEVQQDLMNDIIDFAEGNLRLEVLSGGAQKETDNHTTGVKLLMAVSMGRAVALSPYLFQYNQLGQPNYK
ncbi:MAG: hypothetical protein AAGJ18_21020, partial [Bacteroidota bacterium]